MPAPLDADEYHRWVEQAGRARDAAEAVAADAGHDWACFLFEQAAQLSVKAVLHAVGRPAWGHDLAELCGRAADALGSQWDEAASDAGARLSRHYIPARYPDAHASGTPGAHYTERDVDEARRDCATVFGAVERAWVDNGGER